MRPRSLSTSLLAGLLVTFGDIKALVFYASLFPLFIGTGPMNTLDIGIIVFVVITAVGGIKTAYALAARRFVTLGRNLPYIRFMQRVAVCFMLGAGVSMIARA